MTGTRKLRVFLCHSSQDKPIVRELYEQLKTEGWIDPWLDEEKLLPGQDWDLEIEKAVESADAVVVCLSNNSVTKEGYVQKELRFALNVALSKPDETIFILPLRFDACELPRKLRLYQYADYFPKERRNRTYIKLLKSLQLRAANLVRLTQKDLFNLEDGETTFVNPLGVDFGPPKEFLATHIFYQVSRKPENELVAQKLSINHSGFSVNHLNGNGIERLSNRTFGEIVRLNHLFLTINLWDIPQIPDGFWTRMPCNKKTLVKLLENKKIVFGVRKRGNYYTLLVAANTNEKLKKAIIKFLELAGVPQT